MLTTHIHLPLMLRMSRAVRLPPLECLHDVGRGTFTFNFTVK